jgi:hypothetical protein
MLALMVWSPNHSFLKTKEAKTEHPHPVIDAPIVPDNGTRKRTMQYCYTLQDGEQYPCAWLLLHSKVFRVFL